MNTSLFDYLLPPERIAQHSAEPRDQAKMLVLDRKTGALQDKHIFNLPDFLQPNDLLIFNNSKVFKARLKGHPPHRFAPVEIFLLNPDGVMWTAMAKNAKRLRVGDKLFFDEQHLAELVSKNEDGTITLDFEKSVEDVFALAERLGEIPVPPYVKEQPTDFAAYQTIYAEKVGSVAAPTAGFHFTEKLFSTLDAKGIKRAFVTLHVGIGTFRPMKTGTLEEHTMHSEWIEVPAETIQAIEETKRKGGRVIAVGTTTVRALEYCSLDGGPKPFSGFTQLFITPGYHFKVIDGLITNFHLPKSTLLVLVSSFAGRENILHAYEHAIKNDYRFYSFGDAMLII